MNKTLFVITPIFNPHGFKSRARLYRAFKSHMADTGARLLTVEAAFGGGDFEVTDGADPFNVQLRTDAVLFHKERMINIGRQRLLQLVPDAQFIAWIDADVTFGNPDWAGESVHKLMHFQVIQPFATAVNLNSNEDYMWNCPSSLRSFIEGRGYHQDPPLPPSYTYKGHPGLAWAATRDALDALGGLYDTCVAGSADTVMSNCLKGDWSMYLPAPPSNGMAASMRRWAERCDSSIKTRIGFTRGICLHHWHGKSENRGYEKRWSILSFHKFDPHEDLVLDNHGLYRWAGNKPRLEDDIRLSLSSRNEDEL